MLRDEDEFESWHDYLTPCPACDNLEPLCATCAAATTPAGEGAASPADLREAA